jgi:predicted lipid-binding transport protein (Tim44 family)
VSQQFRHRQFPAGNPLANALVIIAGIIIISLSLALGFVVFVGIAGFMLVMAAVISVRAWWLKRKFGANKKSGQAGPTTRHETHRVIEGEYREVKTSRSGREQDRDV